MSSKSVTCPQCNLELSYDPMAVRLSGLGIICHCGTTIHPEHVKRGRSDDQRRSRAQEKQAAKRYGARTQPASGARPDAKSDIRKRGELRGECKFTRARSFSLKLDELLKLEKEAVGLELPLFEVEFQGVSPPKRYVIIPEANFIALKEKS